MERTTLLNQSRYMMLLHRDDESSALTPKKDTEGELTWQTQTKDIEAETLLDD